MSVACKKAWKPVVWMWLCVSSFAVLCLVSWARSTGLSPGTPMCWSWGRQRWGEPGPCGQTIYWSESFLLLMFNLFIVVLALLLFSFDFDFFFIWRQSFTQLPLWRTENDYVHMFKVLRWISSKTCYVCMSSYVSCLFKYMWVKTNFQKCIVNNWYFVFSHDMSCSLQTVTICWQIHKCWHCWWLRIRLWWLPCWSPVPFTPTSGVAWLPRYIFS